ncbi:periostin-like isoform X2 [Myxocyprinus asiaticus]|uniref:periostin-like isoform X2 n=1 Tax=Myxocyprinus asiaticus TaxID=70543 RepID=UPI002222B71B|nr:periostin-like isoform X2 [Myxocyprinus asiaticus]
MILVFTATFTFLALTSLDQVDCSAYDKIVSHSRIRAKNEGPNMCALQQVMGTKKKYFSTCRNWYKKSICGKKAVVLYECCPGYMKLDGKRGCPAVAPIDSVYGTLGLVNAKITQEYSEKSKLKEEIEGAGSYTMFAPSDDAWELLDPTTSLVSRETRELYNTLHYHMVSKRLLTKDLKNEMTIQSMFNKQGLYINHYSNGVVTVNCARIIHGNQVATNGVVHVIDRVISVIGQTIKDTIETNSELSSLSAAAVSSGLLKQLGKPGYYTLFAPTNEAFEKLDRDVLERLMSDKTVLQALLKYHILNSIQCSEAIMAGSIYETIEGSNIEIGCDGESLTVNGIKMVLKKDIVTSNGVIHLIDQVLMPDSAKQVMELVGPSQNIFSDMVSELGFSAALKHKTEYTVLAPLNGAFSDEIMSMDQRLLKIFLENHILKLKVSLSELYNGQLLETLGGKLLRVFIYRTAVCIENACMVRGSREGSNGVLHLMRSLIQPAQTTIYEMLLKDGRFKIFLSLMESAGLTDLLKQEGSYTLFAPTDEAFETLTEEDITLLKSDINTLRTILLYHFSNGVFINGGLEGGVTNLLKTIQGNNLQVLSVNNSIHVNSVDVPDFDLMASNGVVHVVKTILYPADLPVGREDILFLLKRLIKHMQLKFKSGFTYREIPLTFIRRTITTNVINKGPEIKVIEKDPPITKLTRIIEQKPSGTQVRIEGETGKVTRVTEREPTTKVARIIEGQLPVTTVTKVIESEPVAEKIGIKGDRTISKVSRVIEGDPSITKDTRVIEGDPRITKVTRVIEGDDTRVIEGDPSITKVTKVVERDPSITKVTKVVEGDPSITKVARLIEGDPSITKVTKVVEGDPSITKVTKVVEGDPSITKVARLIEGDPSITKVTKVVEGDPSITKVTKVIEGDPSITKVTKVVEGDPSITKVTKVIEGDPSITKVTKVVEGDPSITKVTKVIEGDPSITKVTKVIEGDPSITKVTRVIEGDPSITKVTRVIEGEPNITKVTRVIEGDPGTTKVTRVIEGDPSTTKVTRVIEGEPSITKVTRVIEGKPSITKATRFIETHSASSDGELDADGETKTVVGEDLTKVKTFSDSEVHILREEDIKHITDAITQGGGPGLTTITGVIKPVPQIIEGGTGLSTITRVIKPEPQIIEGPDFSKIVSLKDNQDLFDAETERITKIIKEGRSKKRAAIRQSPAGTRRRVRLVRRHNKPRQ